MKSIRRFLAVLLTMVMLTPAVSLSESGAQEIPEEEGFLQEEGIPEDWEAAETEEEYWALSMWMAESEGTVKLFDAEENPLDLDDEMRFSGGTVLETEEESMAVVDMDRERLAIMDEISRAGFEKADSGSRISIALKSGAMYFRVGQPLEEEESFDVVMDDIRLAIRGTCGMVQQSKEGKSIILASGHAVIARMPEDSGEPEDEPDEETAGGPGEEPEEIMIEAGEIVSVSKEDTDGGIRFEKKKLAEDEVPAFLTEALRKDPAQLEKVYAETGWQPEKLFGDDIPLWMLPAEELGGIPDEWVGRTLGCGGWYRIAEYYSFPEKNKIIRGNIIDEMMSPDRKEVYTITSVKRYTPHFFELSCQSVENARSNRNIRLILPEITEEEVAQLKVCAKLKFMEKQWDEILAGNRYVLSGMYFDDITAAGIAGAKPFVDYRPSGEGAIGDHWFEEVAVDEGWFEVFAPHCQEFGGAEFPDSLVGKVLTMDTLDIGVMETWEFVSKNTVKRRTHFVFDMDTPILYDDDGHSYREYIYSVAAVDCVSDHFVMLFMTRKEHSEQGCFLRLMLPGMSGREVEFCREYIASQIVVVPPSSVPIDGNSYCTYYFSDDEKVRIVTAEVR